MPSARLRSSSTLVLVCAFLLSACGGGGSPAASSASSSAGTGASTAGSSSTASSSAGGGTGGAGGGGTGGGTGSGTGGSTGVGSGTGTGTGGILTGSTTTPDVTLTVTPTATHPISPYIYGLNGYAGASAPPPGLTLDRAGGNRWTAYDWETNASNAGSDYLYENDAYLSGSSTAADAVRAFVAGDHAVGLASLVTFQMQGLVAGDEAGPVSTTSAPDLGRFKKVIFSKSSQSSAPFTVTPPTTDANVYMDEFLWALDQKFSGQGMFSSSPVTVPTFAELDNEPELWNTTHLEVQGPTAVSSDAYIAKTIALATALKNQFPDLLIFGPVHYGFEGIYNWQGELAATPAGANWFPDKYLPALHAASASYGRPLVDVYDFHWYSEATDGSGNRITDLNSSTLTAAQVAAIVQSPRSLWDASYTENSWITAVLGGPIDILGRLSTRIAGENPGMRIAMTEYNNGGAQHIAGAIAEADDLGIFGVQGLFAASYWPLTATAPFPFAGMRAFRGFDGGSANFGDTSVQTVSSDVASVAGYVSRDSTRPGRVVMVLINRAVASRVAAVSGQALDGTAHVYQLTAASANGQSPVRPLPIGTQAVTGSTLTIALPALSVTTVDIF